MAKLSQLEKAIAALKAERDVLNMAIARLEAQQATKPAAAPARKSKARRPANGDAPTSGTYPTA